MDVLKQILRFRVALASLLIFSLFCPAVFSRDERRGVAENITENTIGGIGAIIVMASV